jgi:hypothetical protein
MMVALVTSGHLAGTLSKSQIPNPKLQIPIKNDINHEEHEGHEVAILLRILRDLRG